MAELGPHEAFDLALAKHGAEQWADALLAAEVMRRGGHRIGGIWLTARAGGVRDAFLDHLGSMFGSQDRWTRLPPGSSLSNLVGGVDIAATAALGTLVRQPGLLSRARDSLLLIPMAERLDAALAATVGAAMDCNADGVMCILALDESIEDDHILPISIADRLALRVDLHAVAWHHVAERSKAGAASLTTPPRLPSINWTSITISDATLTSLSALAQSSRHGSLRILRNLVQVAKILAHIDGRDVVSDTDVMTALRLCLGLRLAPPSEDQQAEPDSAEPPPQAQADAEDQPPAPPEPPDAEAPPADKSAEPAPSRLDALTELLAAVQAGALSGNPLLLSSERPSRQEGRSGKSGSERKNARRGRPFGIGLSPPYPDARPDIVATLRAAAPWQRTRAAQRAHIGATATLTAAGGLASATAPPPAPHRAYVTRDDFRYQRLRHAAPSTAIFVVDASGSTALERLGETKGAIEHLLARCYVRRDEVALIAFRGTSADVLLPPTRSLVAAKRKLAALPGGGPTPLASGLQKGLELALAVRRRGSTPILVLLTDGSGNIALDGTPDRARAAEELTRLAGLYKSNGLKTVCIDIARRPRDSVSALASALGADLHLLRQAEARGMSDLVDTSMREASR
ncbi:MULTISPECIES: VWA domain-containing protein [unclassified Rhizobium]|uniref:VWA domain-containing protein n=1 Tax=unclassified Rhizobium TaxID=2613769 RepID=UPI000A433925|nr:MULTISPECIES: VWA domain-containing protein [unclassified Rhizobium]